MTLKEKFQEWKDTQKVHKSAKALKDVQNQTENVIMEAFDYHGAVILPFIKNLTPDLYTKLEKYREYGMICSESVLSSIPENQLTQEICIEAMKISTIYFEDIPEKFRNYEVYREYVKDYNNAFKLNNVPEKYWTTELLEIAVKSNIRALELIPAYLQTERICEIALKSNEYIRTEDILKYMCKQTEDICLRAVKQNGIALKDAQYQNNEICLAAVQNNGKALQYVKNQTKEICFAAVEENKDALLYIKDKELALLTALYANI